MEEIGGKISEQTAAEKKMKVLRLHGFRTSESFLCKQISKWDPSIFQHFQLDIPDGQFLVGGKSDIEGIFLPPYFEWFQFDKDLLVEIKEERQKDALS